MSSLAKSYLEIATAHREAGRCIKAGEFYRKVIELDPDCFEAHNGLGTCFFSYHNLVGALRSFKRAFEIEPRSMAVVANIAAVLQNQGAYEAALNLFNLVLADDHEGGGWVHYYRGAALFSLGRHDEAVKSYQAAVDAEPDNPGYLSGMIWILDQMPSRDPEEARKLRRKWYDTHRVR